MLVHKKFTIFFALIKLVNFSDFYFNLSKCEILLSNFFFFGVLGPEVKEGSRHKSIKSKKIPNVSQ